MSSQNGVDFDGGPSLFHGSIYRTQAEQTGTGGYGSIITDYKEDSIGKISPRYMTSQQDSLKIRSNQFDGSKMVVNEFKTTSVASLKEEQELENLPDSPGLRCTNQKA